MGEKYNITFGQFLYYFRPIIILLSDESYITLLRILYYFSPSDQSISSITACPQLPQASSDEGKPLSAARQRIAASTEACPDEANQHQH